MGEVYRVDASRRTTAANAYVGRPRQDQAGGALRQPDSAFPRDQVRSGGGARARPPKAQRPPARAALAGLVAPAGTFLAQRAGRALRPPRRTGRTRTQAGPDRAARRGARRVPGEPSASAPRRTCSRARSRRRADAFSLRADRDPASFVQFERRLALRNISDPDPPQLSCTLLFGTHPPRRAHRLRRGVGEARVGCPAREPA